MLELIAGLDLKTCIDLTVDMTELVIATIAALQGQVSIVKPRRLPRRSANLGSCNAETRDFSRGSKLGDNIIRLYM